MARTKKELVSENDRNTFAIATHVNYSIYYISREFLENFLSYPPSPRHPVMTQVQEYKFNIHGCWHSIRSRKLNANSLFD